MYIQGIMYDVDLKKYRKALKDQKNQEHLNVLKKLRKVVLGGFI